MENYSLFKKYNHVSISSLLLQKTNFDYVIKNLTKFILAFKNQNYPININSYIYSLNLQVYDILSINKIKSDNKLNISLFYTSFPNSMHFNML